MPRTKKEKKNTKPWAHPAAQDINSSDDRFDETTGYVRNQDEISKLRKRKGLCPKCGLVRTHKRGVFGVGMSKDTRVGQVYKGVCLQCNTLYQAKMMLGEPVDLNFDRGSVLETHIRPAADQMMSYSTAAASALHANLAANNSSILPPIRQQSVESSRGASSSNQSGNSNTGGNRARPPSGLSPPPPPPQDYHGGSGGANMHPLASLTSSVPTEISHQDDGPCRKMSEISIPPEFQDLNNNDRLSSNASTCREGSIPLVDIVEEDRSDGGGGMENNNIHQEEQYAPHANVTVGSSTSSSADHQSHGAPTSYIETITSSPHPSNARPGVVHFDNSTAEGRGHRPLDRLQQRILEKNRAHGEASKKPPAAGATASPSSSTSSAKTTSTHRRAQSENTTSSSTPTSSHTRSKTQHAPSSLHVPLSPGASCVSASDQFEAQRQRKILDADIIQSKSSESEKSRQGSADEEFNRRLLQKAASSKKTVTTDGGGGDEESKPGVSHHASGKGDTLFGRKVSSSDEDSKPGVTHASSKADSLYNQKMAARRGNRAGDDDSKPGIIPQSGKGSTIYEQKMTCAGTAHDVRGEEEVVAMEEYRLDDVHAQEIIEKCQSCNDLFDFLKENSPLPPVSVIQTLIRMRDLLPPPSETFSPTATSFSKDWCTHIFDAMTAHPSDEDVQAEGFRTVWSIISTNNHLASDVISYAEKKDIMHAMEAHKKSSLVQGCGAGLIACIASTEKYARQILSANDGRFIQRLMIALKFHQIGDEGDHFSHGAVQENAMKALYHLSSASLASSRKMVFFGKKMGSCAGVASAENNPCIHALDAVLHSMGLHPKNVSVQVYGNRLLCNIFNFDEIGDKERCEKWISKYLLYTNAAQTYHIKSQPYCESTICLLSMISSESCTWCDGDVFPKVVTKLMSSSDSSLVAQYGCRCLHNICAPSSGSASDSQAAVASLGGIGIIISSMAEFNEHQSIQSEACLALSALCINSPSNKTIVMEQGGINSIFAAYQSYSSSKQYDSVGLMTKIRACTALISLAADQDCISEMKSIGIVEKLDCLRLEDEKMPVQLSRLIQRLHTLTSEQENDDSLVEFREGASEDETAVCILANLKMIVQKDDDDHHIDTLSLTSNILWAMRKFSMSKPIQENASKLLACLYSSYQSQVGEEIYTEVLETVEASLREHQSDQGVVAAACSVIMNICITSLKAGSETSQILSDILYSSILEVANAMDLCIENANTVEQASGALFALCNTKPSLVVSLGTINLGTSNSIRVLTDAMKKFPTSNELHKNAICVLSSFFTYSDNIIRDERSLECVKNVATALANFIKQAEDEEETTYVALQILKLLSDERGYESKMALSGNVEIIAAIVSSMFSYPNSLLIQGAACDILRSLSVNNHKRAQVCQQGGTTRIISALGRMNTDSTFVCKAFMALENLISGADIDVLTANDTPQVLFNAIDAFPESVNVHIKGAAVIWHLSSRDNSFKDAFVRNGAARLISEAMTRFLPSQDLQQKGFLTIWSLATRKELKNEIGHYATLPIINGLAAHCSPDDLSSSPGGDRQQFCQEGLGALKCLSTSTPNKRVLVEHGAIELITRILWLYNDDDSLCIAALSALSNICVDVDSNQVLRISSDVLDAVVYVMRTHQNVKEVQSIVIVLLRNFTFSPSNCLLLQENPFVSSLVNNAMVRFNTSFQGRAEDVLRVLPSLVQ